MEFSQLAILLTAAAVFGIISRLLKQPLLVGYLFAGLLLSLFGIVHEGETLENFGKVGVTLLLFLLGLEMNLKDLPTIGKAAIMTGLGQIFITSSFGFLLSYFLGFGLAPSLYIAIALSFSSTIIMVKLLSEKKDLTSLYGRIAVGFLLVQDFVAMIILIFLSGLGSGGLSGLEYAVVGLKAIALFTLVWVLSKNILPDLFEKIVANSSELIFIVSIAWAIGIASFVAGPIGFTLEIGGFIAGLALSNLPEHLQIAARTRPLRDFFLTIFFLYLGTQLALGQGILPVIIPALIFSAFVLIGNPLIVLTVMGFLGYKKRTSFMAGLTVAQISEFSFIIMAMGLGIGHLGQKEVATIIVVGVITMTLSTYLILGSEKVYKKVKKYLTPFERKRTKESVYEIEHDLRDHVVLIGSDRTGRALAAFFKRKGIGFLVVDFNPQVFERMTASNVPVIFGDVNDPEIIEDANIKNAKSVISTVSSMEDNLPLLEYIRNLKRKPMSIFTASSRVDALKLYGKGATYVIVPEIAAGEHIRHLFETHGLGETSLEKLGKNHFNRLMQR
jgi:Kef-type K+ transport system membrane component KefB